MPKTTSAIHMKAGLLAVACAIILTGCSIGIRPDEKQLALLRDAIAQRLEIERVPLAAFLPELYKPDAVRDVKGVYNVDGETFWLGAWRIRIKNDKGEAVYGPVVEPYGRVVTVVLKLRVEKHSVGVEDCKASETQIIKAR